MEESKQSVEAVLPLYDGNERKSSYLSYRATGFSINESCELADVHEATVKRWRTEDDNFNYYDTVGISELRKELGIKLSANSFTRNFRMVMTKDYEVLYKAIHRPDKLSKDEKDYLLKLRSHYSPENLKVVQQLLTGERELKDWNSLFTAQNLQINIVKDLPKHELLE